MVKKELLISTRDIKFWLDEPKEREVQYRKIMKSLNFNSYCKWWSMAVNIDSFSPYYQEFMNFGMNPTSIVNYF